MPKDGHDEKASFLNCILHFLVRLLIRVSPSTMARMIGGRSDGANRRQLCLSGHQNAS